MRDFLSTWRLSMTPWHWFLAAVTAIEVLWLLVPPPHGFVEAWYSLRFYPAVTGILVFIQDRMPVPVTALLLLTALAALGFWGRRQWRALGESGQSRWWLLPRAASLAAQVLVLFVLWVLVTWGAGYQRTPVTERWALDNANLNPDESAELRGELLAVIHANADAEGTRARAVASIAASMGQLLDAQGDGRVRVPRQVRATPPGLLLVFSTAGMCVPGAVEPFADGAFDDITFIQVAAHELAHVAGYNRESEATLIGYLAGLTAENPLSRYAVALNIYMDLISRIRHEETRRAAWEALPDRARQDYLRGQEIGAKYRIRFRFLQRIGYRVYDTYLKSQGIEEGMDNYSTGLRLFAGAWRSGLAAMEPHREAANTERSVL